MSTKRILSVAAVLATATLLVGACSSDDDASTNSSTTMAAAPTTEAAMADQTITEIAAANPDFSTLVTALGAAGLTETLSGEGPFTVFAPTNEAFAAVPSATLASLLEPANKDTLTKILTYHVVAGEVMAADVQPGPVTTVEGTDLTVETEGGNVFLLDGKGNRAQVVTTDIVAANGVIHVIDGVLIPADVTV